MKLKLITSCIFLIVLLKYVECDEAEKGTTFKFPIYAYKKHSGLENKYHGRLNRCSMKTDCQNYELEEHQNCILQCISSKCYKEIYSHDPLEEGEVDQRLQSFKGCLSIELL